MKHFFPFFILVILTLNVALPLVERLQDEDVYELAERGTDDADEEGKAEKEKEKEKESISFNNHDAISLYSFDLKKVKKALFPTDDIPPSELYASMPELPPEA